MPTQAMQAFDPLRQATIIDKKDMRTEYMALSMY